MPLKKKIRKKNTGKELNEMEISDIPEKEFQLLS